VNKKNKKLAKNKFMPIIGMEVHAELITKTKMFCGCSANHFNVKPNTQTCPVCLGLPGALPVPNKKAIDWCIMIGLALNCNIRKESKFDRKNYFYPDLPKGFQISQYDMPFCKNGSLKINTSNNNEKIIRINRVHMEEDTGKLIHSKIKGKDITLVDFNRSGVPLVEVVTEPDINSSQEAVDYLKKLQQILRFLGVSDGDMEKGSMRCEANISLARKTAGGQNKLPGYKVELKNINSFKFVKKALEYEIRRQAKILNQNNVPAQETRGYNEKKGNTFIQRSKEEAHDYRYFPEPDIPPVKLKNKDIQKIKNLIPEMPDDKSQRFAREYKIPISNIRLLIKNKKTADYFDQLAKMARDILKDETSAKYFEFLKKIGNMIVNKKIDITKFPPGESIKFVLNQKQKRISDKKMLSGVLEKVIKNNAKAVSDYQSGKKEVLAYLIGQTMKQTKGRANPQIVEKMLIEKLS
jgi:aspartyl-tRNA(Asn)/glutamyl-tRNA(Gln) amidotransferase subunit B